MFVKKNVVLSGKSVAFQVNSQCGQQFMSFARTIQHFTSLTLSSVQRILGLEQTTAINFI